MGSSYGAGRIAPPVSHRVPVWNLDGELLADLDARGELETLLDLLGRFTFWVDPTVARAVPVVYPKTARLPSRRQLFHSAPL